MKKEYISPEFETVRIRIESSILTVSQEDEDLELYLDEEIEEEGFAD